MTAAPDFDADWASPADWVGLYRGFELQVVPCHDPAGPDDQSWKRPRNATWKQWETDPIPESQYERWYRRGGEFARSSQMGAILGEASGRKVCVDLDTVKCPQAATWWQGLLTVENYGREPETWKARSGSGGRHLFFKYPSGFAMPTNKTSIGVDVRGQGGFIVLAPSIHNNGRSYEWEDGFAPWQTDLATAPDWLIVALEELIRQHGGTGKSRERTASEAEFNSFGRRVDGRETYMADTVWAAMIDRHREWDFPGTPAGRSLNEWAEAAFAIYRDNVASRLPPDGSSEEDRLEREGRGRTAFRAKWLAAFRKWDTAIAEEAKKPKDEPKEAPEDAPAEKPSPQPGTDTSRFTYRSYDWPDPARLSRREWLYGRHLIRGYLSLLVAPGATGKTSLAIAETLDMVTGRGFLEEAPEPLRVGFWCGEDPLQELKRRFAAAFLHYKISRADVEDRFFLNSGHEDPLRLAIEKPRGLAIDFALRDAIVAAIRCAELDVAIFDPLITMHLVNENSNVSINALADLLKDIAHDTDCAIYLLHHLRKGNGAHGEFTADDARGAKALVDAARSVRVLNVMTADEADRVGIPANERTRHFRVDDGKANMARPPELAVWRRLESVDLGNGGFGLAGDNVQVAVAWKLPGLFDRITEAHLCEVQRQMGDGEFATATQTENWLGWLVGQVTGLETQSKGGRAHVRQVIEVWVKAGAILETEAWNAKSRRMQAVYRCGSRDRRGAQS